MGIDYTTTALIANAKRRILSPSAQTLFPDASIVEFLNDALQITIVPEIKACREEFFVVRSDVAIVNGTDTYSIPIRAYAGALRDLALIDPNGNESMIPQITPMNMKNASGYASHRMIYGFYFEGNKIRIFPTPVGGAASLRFRVERRPNNLTLATNAMTIVSVNAGASQFTTASVPAGIFTVGTVVDFIKDTPYFESAGDDYTITAVAGATFTMAGGLPAGLAAGNYVARTGFSPIPQIPYEGMLVLCQIAAGDMLASMRDEQAEEVKEKAKEMLASFIKSINPRVEGTLKKITNKNGIFQQGSVSGYW